MNDTIAARYTLGEPLGRGGMGQVFAGTDTQLGRPVALKRLVATGDLAELARGEGERMARISDKRHVVEVFDLVSEGDELWVVMELVPGGRTLADLVARAPVGGTEACDADQARRLLEGALAGLAAIHASGVAHGDVKGDNLLVSEGGDLKIADFGIAQMEGDAQRTQAFGTARTTAPEVFEGRLGPAADVYALGHTFYELLAGADVYAREFAGPLEAEVAAAAWTRWHLDPEHMPAPLEDVAGVDADLSRLVERMMAKDPARRIQVDDALRWLRGGGDDPSTVPGGAPGAGRREGTEALAPPTKPAGRWGLVPYAAGGGLLLLVVLGLALTRGDGDGGDPGPGADDGSAAEAPVVLPPPSGPTRLETPLVSRLREGEPWVTAERALRVRGRVLNPRAPHVTVTLGDAEHELAIARTGEFDDEVPLAEGQHATLRLAVTGLDDVLELPVVQDPTPPELALVAPAEGSVHGAARVEVELRAADEHLADVRLQGRSLEPDGEGRWRGSVDLERDGPESIAAEAVDAAGHVTRLAFELARDLRAPELATSTPAPRDVLEAGAGVDFALAFDEPLAEASVDGVALALDADGLRATGTVPVPDVDGGHEFRWSARDLHGNVAEGRLAVRLDSRWGDVPRDRRGDFELLDPTPVADGERRFPAALRHRATGVELVFVPGGTFELGDPEAGLESRAFGWHGMTTRPVRLSGFYLGRTETTRGQWRAGGGEGAGPVVAAAAPDATDDAAPDPDDALPVTDLTWEQAAGWCARQGLELPSEAQWEYAASGAEDARFPWGPEYLPDRANARGTGAGRDAFEGCAPAGSLEAGRAWCGALDLAGNVWEWTRDPWRDSHAWVAPDALDPVAEGDARARVVRGGSFEDPRPELSFRTWFRRARRSDASGPELGFRPALRF